jgi:hypothetical protein
MSFEQEANAWIMVGFLTGIFVGFAIVKIWNLPY